MKKRLVLLGPPGAGKGTQAQLLAEELSIPHISTGDLFRANIGEGTELGVEAKSYIDAGNLVPDSLTDRMVADRLSEEDAQNGFLLDGYPRNTGQADALAAMLADAGVALDGVLNFVINEDVVVERMLARGREDDKEDVIRNRLDVYRQQTKPLIDYYSEKLITVDAEGEIAEVQQRVLDVLR